MASQVTVLDVPADRGICCHVGGDIDFDAAGNLYLSTGDDTNPFDSAGYAPIDERTNRNPAYDAQRSAGNTNDLRGKILRIKVNANGTYSIPAGNLFAPGTANTRPEIYAMGFRNPFRMSVDKATGVVYVGDYGPDAGSTNANRGPSGQVEFNRVTVAGQLRLAVLHRHEHQHRDVQRVELRHQQPPAPKYNCTGGPTNNSFRNTGQTTLPAGPAGLDPVRRRRRHPAGVRRRLRVADGRPGLPLRRREPVDDQVPAGLRRAVLRRRVRPRLDQADPRQRRRLAAARSTTFPWTGKQVMDMAFGPDGALYVLDYGTGFFNGDANSALYRFDYIAGGNRAPTAVATANPTSGAGAADGHLLLGRLVRPGGRRADLLVGVRRRHHLDGGQPDARRTPPTAPTPRR